MGRFKPAFCLLGGGREIFGHDSGGKGGRGCEAGQSHCRRLKHAGGDHHDHRENQGNREPPIHSFHGLNLQGHPQQLASSPHRRRTRATIAPKTHHRRTVSRQICSRTYDAMGWRAAAQPGALLPWRIARMEARTRVMFTPICSRPNRLPVASSQLAESTP